MTERKLSPQAQAVLDFMYEVNMDFNDENYALAAAALRAAADQVGEWESAEELRAIADELGSNNV